MSMVGLPDSLQAVELDWYNDDDVVRVTPRSQQRFEIQKDRAIQVLQLAHEADQFQKQFSLLLTRLARWLCDYQEQIEKAVVTLQDNVLAFVIVRKAVKYDAAFEDRLAELDLEVANDADMNLIKLKTLALPQVSEDALRSFVDQRLLLEYQHGQRSGSHSAC